MLLMPSLPSLARAADGTVSDAAEEDEAVETVGRAALEVEGEGVGRAAGAGVAGAGAGAGAGAVVEAEAEGRGFLREEEGGAGAGAAAAAVVEVDEEGAAAEPLCAGSTLARTTGLAGVATGARAGSLSLSSPLLSLFAMIGGRYFFSAAADARALLRFGCEAALVGVGAGGEASSCAGSAEVEGAVLWRRDGARRVLDGVGAGAGAAVRCFLVTGAAAGECESESEPSEGARLDRSDEGSRSLRLAEAVSRLSRALVALRGRLRRSAIARERCGERERGAKGRGTRGGLGLALQPSL